MIQDIETWSLGYLKGTSHYPVDGEYGVGDLLFSYWIHKEYLANDLTGEIAAKSDYEKDRLEAAYSGTREYRDCYEEWKDYLANEHLNRFTDSEDWVDRRALARALARKLEKSRGKEIEYRGRARGRKYRHKETRPKINAEIIARLIESIMKDYEDEMSWMDLLDPVQNWLIEFHRRCEKTPNKANNLWKDANLWRKPIKISLDEMKPIVFSFSLSQSGKTAHYLNKYIGKFTSNLEDWVESVYSDEWFLITSSNIQRHLRDTGEVVRGSKRGMWTHKQHQKEAQKDQMSKAEESMVRLMEISSSIDVFITLNTPADPISKARLMQLSSEFEMYHTRITQIIEKSDAEAVAAK
jgi:hypothetical protein